MQTVYARGGGSQQREVADGADVVFTDTSLFYARITKQLTAESESQCIQSWLPGADHW